jgi:DNA-binding NarL/FixJ family response regulator
VTARTVAVVHREAMVAESLAAALARHRGLVPVVATTSTAEAERWAERIDAAVMDSSLPAVEVSSARLRRKGVRVVYLGSLDDDERMSVSSTSSVAALAAALVPGLREVVNSTPLTPRERQVLSLVAEGLAAKQVARQLGISHKTVERHKTRIFAKLRVPNQTAAVRVALADGLTRSAAWT